MRIVVISDSHGRTDRVRAAIAQQPQADLFIFLGDGLRDFKQDMRGVPKEDWCVCGNCDFGYDVEYNLVSYVRDIKFFCTHGHQWNVKLGLEELLQQAKEKGAGVVLYGHTHQSFYKYCDGMHVMNPGSIGNPRGPFYPTYGVIDIQGKNIVCSILKLEEEPA